MIKFLVARVGVSLRAVVRAEDHDGVGLEAARAQRREQLPARIVGLAYEVAIRPRLGFAVERIRRDDGRVRRGQREVEEERLVLALAGLNVFHALARECGQHLIEVPIRTGWPGPTLPCPLFGLAGNIGESGIRGGNQPVVLNPSIGRKIDDIVSEVIIEPMIKRTARELFGPVEIGVLNGILRRARFANGVPVHAEMPLADAGRRVALLPQHRRHRQLSRLEHRSVVSPGDAMKIPPVMAARQHRVARRRADAGGAMPVGEAQSLGREPVEMRRGNL